MQGVPRPFQGLKERFRFVPNSATAVAHETVTSPLLFGLNMRAPRVGA